MVMGQLPIDSSAISMTDLPNVNYSHFNRVEETMQYCPSSSKKNYFGVKHSNSKLRNSVNDFELFENTDEDIEDNL